VERGIGEKNRGKLHLGRWEKKKGNTKKQMKRHERGKAAHACAKSEREKEGLHRFEIKPFKLKIVGKKEKTK